ncbi:MAG: hypothetical protein D6800_04980, partial [Candidatus Zixiibacteriota bacterium]
MNSRRHVSRYRVTRFVFPAIALMLLSAGMKPVGAAVFETGNSVQIARLQNIRDDFYVLGADNARIDGFVEGDFAAFAGNVTIAGEVGRSANLFTRNLTVDGSVKGTLRGFAEVIEVNGFVGGSLMLFGRTIDLRSEAVIDRSADCFGQTITIDGTIRGNTRIRCQTLRLTGIIEGDLDVDADSIFIDPPAVIRGDLTYESTNEAHINTEDGVTIVGDVTWNKPEKDSGEGQTDYLAFWTKRVAGLLAAFVFGLIMVRLFRPYAEESLAQARNRLSVSLASGVVILLATGICLVLAVVSVALLLIGLATISGSLAPLGMLALVVSTLLLPVVSLGSVTGAVLFYTGKIVVGFL